MSGTIVKRYYFAAKGSHLKDEDARLIGDFIETECDGVITADEFVTKAWDPASPLHGYLEWDDTIAAHEFRLEQARHVIRSIVVYDERAPGEKIRAFHHVNLSDGEARDAYVSHEIVWQKPDLVDQVVHQAYQELRAFTRKYEAYRELEPLVSVIREAINT